MPIIAKEKGGGDYKLMPADMHRAVCDMLVDLGVQPSNLYEPKHQVYIRWATPDETIEYEKDGETVTGPMVIGSFYTVSLSEKSNLRPMLENWRGRPFTAAELKGFDLADILGKPCMIQVQHKENAKGEKRAKVTNVTRVPKGMETPTIESEPFLYDDANQDKFGDLPEWLQKKVSEQIVQHNDEPKGDEPPHPVDEEEVPF